MTEYEKDHPKPPRRQKRTRDPSELKRPQSAYFFFLADFRELYKVQPTSSAGRFCHFWNVSVVKHILLCKGSTKCQLSITLATWRDNTLRSQPASSCSPGHCRMCLVLAYQGGWLALLTACPLMGNNALSCPWCDLLVDTPYSPSMCTTLLVECTRPKACVSSG